MIENVLIDLLLRAPYKEGTSYQKKIDIESNRMLMRQYRGACDLAWKAYSFFETLRAS